MERLARKSRQELIQHAEDRAAACWTLHTQHPGEGWECAAQEYAHLANVLHHAGPRPEHTGEPDDATSPPDP